MAEHILRAAVMRADLAWVVRSAGTQASHGGPMDGFAVRALAERGLSVANWSTTPLTSNVINNADLVLTAESHHRAAVADLMPTAVGRTFTLLQFARLAAASTPALAPASVDDLGRELIDRARAARGISQPAPLGANELVDPIGRPMAQFRDCAEIIDRAVHQIVRAAVGEHN